MPKRNSQSHEVPDASGISSRRKYSRLCQRGDKDVRYDLRVGSPGVPPVLESHISTLEKPTQPPRDLVPSRQHPIKITIKLNNIPPPEDHISPPEDHIPPSGKHIFPPEDRIPPPPGPHILPLGDRVSSPSGGRIPPPPGVRVSPLLDQFPLQILELVSAPKESQNPNVKDSQGLSSSKCRQNSWLKDEFFQFKAESLKARFKDTLVCLVEPNDLVLTGLLRPSKAGQLPRIKQNRKKNKQSPSHPEEDSTPIAKKRSGLKEKFLTQKNLVTDSSQVSRPTKKTKHTSRTPSPYRVDMKSVKKNLEFSFFDQPKGVDYPYLNQLADLDNCVPLPRQPRSSNLILRPDARLNGDISGMQLPTVQQSLPYNSKTLTWNKEKTTNKQGVYCYCGGGGEWYRSMVQCVRCSQWFHERCLAPRPRNMPIVQGDTNYLFVCSLCNYGVECLRRMPVSWPTFLHIAIFDLSIKTERRYHDLKTELLDPLLAGWHLYQLPRSLNVLTDAIKEKTVLDLLRGSPIYEEAGGRWGLKDLRPPPRGNYKLSDKGFVSERNVLDDVITGPDLSNTDVIRLSAPTPRRLPASSSPRKPSHLLSSASERRNQIKPSHHQPTISKLLRSARLRKSASSKPKAGLDRRRRENGGGVWRTVSKGRVEDPEPPLFLEVAPLLEKPLEVVKPLPFQIAKDLYAQGFPKVCVKFASIVPPRKQEVETILVKKSRKKKRQKTRPPSTGTVKRPQNGSLEALIPTKLDYLGSNNPFDSGRCSKMESRRNQSLTFPCRPKERLRKQKRVFGAEKRKLWKIPHLSLVNGHSETRTSINGNIRSDDTPIAIQCKGSDEPSNGILKPRRLDSVRTRESVGRVEARESEIAGRWRSSSGDVRYFVRTRHQTGSAAES